MSNEQAPFVVRTAYAFDVTQETQAVEDRHLRERLRDRAEYVRRWCERVVAECDSAATLEAMRLDLSGIAYPIAELMQYAGAVDNLRHTRVDPGSSIVIERAPRPAPIRKRGRR